MFRSHLIRYAVVGLIIGMIVIVGVYLLSLTKPAANSGEMRRFVVAPGTSTGAIASRLQEEGLIRSQLMFRAIVKQQGLGGQLQAGSFELSPTMSPAEIAQALTEGTDDLWVTIPEGWRREQIAASLAEQDLAAFNPDEFLSLTAMKEGRLFPDTYLIARESTAATITSIFLNTFTQKVTEGLADEIMTSPYEFEQALIMASIVEREARGAEEMRHVAGILWNRYELGMPLQADATLQYVRGFDRELDAWWSPPSAADKQLESPFNTYLHVGLPPHPISNPGLDAISAALNPQVTQDLYYLHDRTGAIHYGQTLEEHNANVQQYLR